MLMYTISEIELKTQYQDTARTLFNKELNELDPYELNSVIAHVVKSKAYLPNWDRAMNIYSEQRITVYFSIEVLPGRVVLDVMDNLDILEASEKIFKEQGIDIKCLEKVDDPALGNGGLGRLAACYLESAATMKLPLYGVGLYYKYGLFKQTFNVEGQQVEVPDDWTANGEPWFEPIEAETEIIEFQGTKVKAVPCIMPVIGYGGNAFPLRLWKAEPIEGQSSELVARISDYLYPNDKVQDGPKLRICQEYFFVAAELQRIFNIHLKKHGTLDNIEEYYFFQMNDTHPVFGCLEFIRLLKQHGYSFEEAFQKAKRCFAYTNHTVLSEALEKWPIVIFKDTLPSLFKVVEELNQALIDELLGKPEFHYGNTLAGNPNWGYIREHELFANGVIHMSRIACYVGNKINGVAAVHTEIIKKDLLNNWYRLYQERLCNITNGVTPRRWIKLANPALANFLTKRLGDGWITNLSLFENLEQFGDDYATLANFASTKRIAKAELVRHIEEHEGIYINPDSIFDCQVKRIHLYKRQDMNALRILYIYDRLKKGELPDFYPTTFIFGGKAAAAFYEAKRIIELIKDIQEMVNNDPDVNDKMKVVFLTNYNVSYGEKVYAAADLSEQISTAGKEASGTGNMKFMMNGACTIGTMDGANIEIVQEAGEDNNFIFGASVEKVEELKRNHNQYQHEFLPQNKDLEEILEYLKGRRGLKKEYWDIANTLQYNDRYYVMYDLRSYIEATMMANKAYAEEQRTGDLSHFTRKCFMNTVHSGVFSSDRSVQQYAEQIWHIEPVSY